MDPGLERLCELHGGFLRREAIALGYSPRAFQRLVSSGVITRVRPGAYTSTERWAAMSTTQQYAARSRAAARTAKTPVVLSHLSSLSMLTDQWWDLPLDEVHLTRKDGRTGRRETGVHQHAGLILPGDIEYADGVERMNPSRTALEVATIVDLERALVVTNALLHAGLTTAERLAHQAVDMQQWPGSLTHEMLLRHCDPRIESVGETRTYMALHRAGFPRPHPQFEVFDRDGRLFARLDFAILALGIWLEFDGKVKYAKHLRPGESVTDAILREKKRERIVAQMTGLECARLDWFDLEHPHRLVQTVNEAVRASAGRRGTS